MKFYKSFNKGKYMTNYIGCASGLGKNKAFELNLYFAFRLCFNLMTGLTTKCDHAGFEFRLDICGLELELKIYDSRHWFDKENRWYEPGEEMRLYEERKAKGQLAADIEYGTVNLLDDEEHDPS